MADRGVLEKGNVLLATNLEQGYELGFITFEDVVRRVNVKGFLAHGLVKLAKLAGYDKIAGALYDEMDGRDNKSTMLSVWAQALKGDLSFYEELLTNIPTDKLPGIFRHWIVEERCVTWAHLVTAFPKPLLSACAADGLRRAEILADAPGDEILEEEVEMVVQPADAEPTDGD